MCLSQSVTPTLTFKAYLEFTTMTNPLAYYTEGYIATENFHNTSFSIKNQLNTIWNELQP